MAKLGKKLGKSYATIFSLGGMVELKKKKKRKKDANRNNK